MTRINVVEVKVEDKLEKKYYKPLLSGRRHVRGKLEKKHYNLHHKMNLQDNKIKKSNFYQKINLQHSKMKNPNQKIHLLQQNEEGPLKNEPTTENRVEKRV